MLTRRTRAHFRRFSKWYLFPTIILVPGTCGASSRWHPWFLAVQSLRQPHGARVAAVRELHLLSEFQYMASAWHRDSRLRHSYSRRPWLSKPLKTSLTLSLFTKPYSQNLVTKPRSILVKSPRHSNDWRSQPGRVQLQSSPRARPIQQLPSMPRRPREKI